MKDYELIEKEIDGTIHYYAKFTDGQGIEQITELDSRGEFLALFIYPSRGSGQEVNQFLNVEWFDFIQMQMTEFGNENTLDSSLIKQKSR